MKIIISLFLIVTFSKLVAAPVLASNLQSEPIYKSISVAQAKDTISIHLNDPWFVILDVRTPAEYSTYHLEKGVNIDYYSADFSEILSTLDKSKIYLIHCASGNRSGKVFTMMQNMNFQTVYNMTGGMGAWQSAGYPTTTSTSPILAVLGDTIINFKNILTHTTDSVKVTITNAANDILTFSNFTDLSGTSFTTNFNRNITISGAHDYLFYLYYSPVSSLKDSTIFKLESNGGIINFLMKGSAIYPTNIHQTVNSTISIINDKSNKQIIIESYFSKSKTRYIFYDTSGEVIISSNQINGKVIDYSNLKNGIYILQIISEGVSKTFKLQIISE
jgi:rhodanese-related sulfurtransferase